MYSETVDPSNKVQQIIKDENARINLKEKKIDVAYNTKKRKELFLSSTTAKNNIYRQMYMVVAVVVLLVTASTVLIKYFPLFPTILHDLFIIALVGSGFIYLIVLYVELQKRDKIDFHKIDFNSLMKPTVNKSKSVAVKENIVHPPPSSECIGEECCIASSIFVDNKCQKKEGFAGNLKPFSPFPPYTSTQNTIFT